MIRVLFSDRARRAARRVRIIYAIASVAWVLAATFVSLWSLTR